MIAHYQYEECTKPFHTTMLLDAHQCTPSSTAETMHIDHVHIVQLYKHSVAIELYRKVYPDVLQVPSIKPPLQLHAIQGDDKAALI